LKKRQITSAEWCEAHGTAASPDRQAQFLPKYSATFSSEPRKKIKEAGPAWGIERNTKPMLAHKVRATMKFHGRKEMTWRTPVAVNTHRA
jgi:hypothetical protein